MLLMTMPLEIKKECNEISPPPAPHLVSASEGLNWVSLSVSRCEAAQTCEKTSPTVMTRLAGRLADTPGLAAGFHAVWEDRGEEGEVPPLVSVAAVCPSTLAVSCRLSGPAACLQLRRELIQLPARFPRRSRHCIIATAAPDRARARAPLLCASPRPRVTRLPPVVTITILEVFLFISWVSHNFIYHAYCITILCPRAVLHTLYVCFCLKKK